MFPWLLYLQYLLFPLHYIRWTTFLQRTHRLDTAAYTANTTNNVVIANDYTKRSLQGAVQELASTSAN